MRQYCPNTEGDDEYTPAQRRVINARLAKADKEIKVAEPWDRSITPTI